MLGDGCCPGCAGSVGKSMPSDFELNVRLSQNAESERDGSSAARACRIRASASSLRNVASATGAAWPDASRTASANESCSGVWAVSGRAPGASVSASSSRIFLGISPSLGGTLREAAKEDVNVVIEELPCVEPLRRAQRERVLPVRGVQHRRNGQPDGKLYVHGSELASLDAPLDRRREQAVAATDDLIVEEPRQRGEVARLGHHQLRDTGQARLADARPPIAHQATDQVRRAALMLGHELLTARERWHDGLEERFLAVEVEVDGAFGHAGAACHVGKLRGRETALHEQLERGGQDLSRARLLTALPAGTRATQRLWGEFRHRWLQLLTERSVSTCGSLAPSRGGCTPVAAA